MKRRHEQEPRPQLGVGEAPAGFNAAQRAIWERLVRDAPSGLLARSDADVLAGYAVLIATRESALELFNAAGSTLLVRSADGLRITTNPYLREYRRLTEQLRLLMGELGFTPSARSRVSRIDTEDDDPLDAFTTA